MDTPVCDEPPYARCAGADAGEGYEETGCFPAEDISEDVKGELFMPLVLDAIDSALHEHHPRFRPDGIRYAAFRQFLVQNYLNPNTHGADLADEVFTDPAGGPSGFRLKSFGAHYHELDMTGFAEPGAGHSIELNVERGTTGNPLGGTSMPPEVEVWAEVFFVRRGVLGGVVAEVALPELSWFMIDPEAEGPASGTFFVPNLPEYETAVLVVTAFEGSYGPVEGSVVCTAADEASFGHPRPRDWLYQCSGGYYTLQVAFDGDGDGVPDDIDNCMNVPNPDQANCDAANDEREDVERWRRGDACDPDRCMDLASRASRSAELSWTELDVARLRMGDEVGVHFRGVGGEPHPFDPRSYASGRPPRVEPVRMRHCECEPHPEDEARCLVPLEDCPDDGTNPELQWQSTRWSRLEDDRFVDGDSDIPDVTFAHPERPEALANKNRTDLRWRWREDLGWEDGDPDEHAMLWLRPREPDWEDWKGNTYSDLWRLRITEHMSIRWLPWNLRQLGLIAPPRALDLIPLRPLPRPWDELVDRPFDLPSLLLASRGSPLAQSRYALLPTDRAVLGALAVRHQSTETGFVSEYVPARFEGGGQLDLGGFAFTVMLETGTPNASSEGEVQTLNDGLSLWAFGGVDRNRQFSAELWRGALDRSEQETFYRFTRLDFSNAPSPRARALLLADVEGQRLVLLGGRSPQGRIDEVWALDLATQQWSRQQVELPADVGRVGAAAASDGEHVYLFGGRGAQRPGRRLWRIDLRTLRFEPLSDVWRPGPGARIGASMVLDATRDVVYLHGGHSPPRGYRNDLWAFDLNRQRWQRLADDCQPGDACPPPARGSSLLSSGTPGAVTLALGSPTVAWDRTEHEWRYVLSQGRWYPEDELRGSWHHEPPQLPPGGWCLSAAPGERTSGWCWLFMLFFYSTSALLIRRKPGSTPWQILLVVSFWPWEIGCTYCKNGTEHDSGAVDTDVANDVPDDQEADTDADPDHQPDGDVEDDIPDGAVRVHQEEIPRERIGLDCGAGCRQLSFRDEVVHFRYDVDNQFIVYEGGDSRRRGLFLADLDTGKEIQFEWCTYYEGDTDACGLPAIHNGTVSFPTTPWNSDNECTLWRYRIGDGFRIPLVTRYMTAPRRPLMYVDLYNNTVAWYDSAIEPAGLYTMSIDGGDVIGLTRNECVCYGGPHLWGREVVYENFRGYSDIAIVNIDTLEERNLNDDRVEQWTPAFDGQWVVWSDGRNDPCSLPSWDLCNTDIYGMEMPDGEIEPLCDHPAVQTHPDVHLGLVAWEDFRNAEDPNDGNARDADIDIYLLDLETRREVQVTSLPGPERMPRIWGRRLFYVAEDLIGQQAIFMVDLDEAGLL